MAERQELALESLQIDFNSSNPVEEDFLNLVKRVILSTNADVYIAFDTSANSDDFLLVPADGILEIDNAQFTRLSALGASSNGTLYVIASRA